MGRSDIVRLLLEAGADVSLRDNLGLTATDWAQRKGFIDVTQLLKNPARARHSASTPATSKDIERKSVYAPDNDSRTEPQTGAPRKDQQGFGPAAAAFLKAQTKPRPPEPTLVQPPPTDPSVPKPDDPRTWWVSSIDSSPADDALLTESDTLKTRIETERIFEQARLRVEEEVRRKTEEHARRVPGTDGSAGESRTRQVAKDSLKRCPKCNTIYEDDGRTYCAYDAGRLVSVQDSFNGSSTSSFSRPTLWVLVAVTLIGSVAVTYFATTYLNKNEAPNPAATVAAEKVSTVEDNAPVVGGVLAGKQENVPKADYPANFQTPENLEPVTVVVRVNRNGRVISARALNGPRQLRAAAEQAARTAKFSEEKLKGEDRVAGTITYTFKP